MFLGKEEEIESSEVKCVETKQERRGPKLVHEKYDACDAEGKGKMCSAQMQTDHFQLSFPVLSSGVP
jgi:hypothetical protein